MRPTRPITSPYVRCSGSRIRVTQRCHGNPVMQRDWCVGKVTDVAHDQDVGVKDDDATSQVRQQIRQSEWSKLHLSEDLILQQQQQQKQKTPAAGTVASSSNRSSSSSSSSSSNSSNNNSSSSSSSSSNNSSSSSNNYNSSSSGRSK